MSETTKSDRPDQAPKSDNGAKQTSDLYDRFVEFTRETFELGQEKGHEAWEKSMELARQKLAETGGFSAEQGEAFKRYLRRDLEQTRVDMLHLGKEAKVSLNPARLGAGALSTLAKLLHTAGVALTSLSEKAENVLEYKSGEITMAGTLTCSSCGHKIQLHQTSAVPTCAQCKGTIFRKGY